jgi:hypothetical protein
MTDETGTVPTEQTESQQQSNAKEKYYVRFTLAQRYLHVVLFTSFLGLAATGLPMRFSDNVPAQFFARVVGGFGAILFFHKFCAVVLTLAFLYHLKDIASRALVHREKGIFWGADIHGAQLERRAGHRWPPALVCRNGPQAQVRALCLLGEVRLLGRLLGHDRHWFFQDTQCGLRHSLPGSCRDGR